MTGTRNLPGTHITEHAPCWGDPDFAVDDDRWTNATDLIRLCEPVLYVCGHCPFRAACIRQVRPSKSEFSGICGGRIWVNGAVVRALPGVGPEDLPPPVNRKACGTAAGVRAHRRAVEQQCSKCDSFTQAGAQQLELDSA
ncbi:hypothetical protein [Streptomyces hydrogenans]|uniref:hypothetical protein n=1 Tax=Streptomyces hydrogenans TaxID=1873719 RepID=UPI0035E361F6